MFVSKRKNIPEFRREPIEMVRLLGASCLQVTLENGLLFPTVHTLGWRGAARHR